MLLVAVEQSLRSGDIIGQFVGIDEGFHLRHPAGQIPEVSSETLQPGKDDQKTAEVRRALWRAALQRSIFFGALSEMWFVVAKLCVVIY